MKTDVETIRESFHMGYEAYFMSLVWKADTVWDMYHNRQWTLDQLALLETRGQPKETFNVIKRFSRMLIGYYSGVINHISVESVQEADKTVAALLSDVITSTLDTNNMELKGDSIKLGGIISGLFCASVNPVATGKTDEYGRPIYGIEIEQVPDYELVLDPMMSTKEDYSDARFLHRFKWLSEETVRNEFGEKILGQLESYYNTLDIPEAEFDYNRNEYFQGRYRVFDNYLVVHTVVVDDKGDRWSIHWSNETIISKIKITHKKAKWELQSSSRHRY